MLTLREIVNRYLTLAGEYGRPVPLESFGLTPEETEAVFSVYEDDYRISRFLEFRFQPESATSHRTYQVNGFPQTHVSIQAGIASIL